MFTNMTTGVHVADDGLDPSDLFSGVKRKRIVPDKDAPSVCRTDDCKTRLREKNRHIGFCECCQRRRARN